MAILKSDAVQAAVKQATQSGTTNSAQKSNAQAASIYKASQQYLKSPYFSGVGSSTVYSPPPIKPSTNTSDKSTTPQIDPNPYVAPQPPPPPPPPPPTAKDLGVVKTPGRDVTRISDLVQQTPADTIKRLAFEQLSAIELSQVVTSNTVDGVNQKYSIISNLSEIRTRFDTSKQLSIMNKSTPMTSVYTIDIDSKIPGEAYFIRNNLFTTNSYIDVDGTTVVEIEKRNIYIDTNGDLVIEFDNTIDDEIAQVQINSDGTIYEVTE